MIQKKFILYNSEVQDKLANLLSEIPIEYIQISEEIIQLAKKDLKKNLNENIYITLTDHLHFAMERNSKGIQVKNGLLWEIKQIYPDEFKLGIKALDIIEQRNKIRLPEDEAGFIALHIVTAELDEKVRNVRNITKIVTDIINIIKYHFAMKINEHTLDYQRFDRHIKFFAQRVVSSSLREVNSEDGYEDIYQVIKEKFVQSNRCAGKVAIYIKSTHSYSMSTDDLMYLTIHIERIARSSIAK